MNENGQFGNFTQAGNSRVRCDCHDCTQARYRMSTQGGILGSIGAATAAPSLQQLKAQAELAQPDTSGRLICGCMNYCKGHNGSQANA